MKNFYLILILSLSIMKGYSTNNMGVVVKDGKDMNVVLSNVCEFYETMLVCEGDSNAGQHPVLASGGCMFNNHSYTFYDSLSIFNEARFLGFSSMGFAPGPYDTLKMFVGSETKILSFDATYLTYSCDSLVIIPQDTLSLDSILSGETNFEGLVVLRSSVSTNNLYVYDDNLNYLYSFHLNMTPMFISSPRNSIYCGVVGLNQNQETVLNVINLNTQQIIKDTVLGNVSHPVGVNVNSNTLYIAFQPGDSAVMMFKYNVQSGVITTSQLFAGSGVNVGEWSSYTYEFQPSSDVSGNFSDRKIFVWNNFNMHVDSFDIGRRLKSLIMPGDDYPFIVAVDSADPNKAIYYYDNNYLPVDSFLTPTPPLLFAGDFRCPMKVSEYDDSKVKWTVYPNPSRDDFKISASGLICGRDYQLDIVDEMGKVVYQSTVHSKMTIVLPTSNFESGVYFVRIHTLKGFITQQIIKQ
jgi:hypothetical protein